MSWTGQLLNEKRLTAWYPIFLFGTMGEEIDQIQTLFTGPVWLTLYGNAPVALFTPLQDKEETDGDHNDVPEF
jgi:hypothetical protein